MFERDQQSISELIRSFCAARDIPLTDLKWVSIPFSGEWEISTSFFTTADAEAKAGRSKGKRVPMRAQEIAGQVKDALGDLPVCAWSQRRARYLPMPWRSWASRPQKSCDG